MGLLHIQNLQIDTTQANNTELQGKIIVFTGGFAHMSRAELKLKAEEFTQPEFYFSMKMWYCIIESCIYVDIND